MRLGIGHVVDQSDPRRAGDNLARKLELLCRQTLHVRRYSRDIASRPGVAPSEAERGSWPRAEIGHVAAAPPTSVMNCRRLMCSPYSEDHTLPHCCRECPRCASRQNWLAMAEPTSIAATVSAITGCEQPQQGSLYSITSSAWASGVAGTSRPSALAVLRLMTNSCLVGACTGRSAGFSPLRIT